jgi:hypothetical protein
MQPRLNQIPLPKIPFEHPFLGFNTHFERRTGGRPKISNLAKASRPGLASPPTAKNIWAIGNSILLDTLDLYLSKCSNQISAGILKDGWRYSFLLQYTGPKISVFKKNVFNHRSRVGYS